MTKNHIKDMSEVYATMLTKEQIQEIEEAWEAELNIASVAKNDDSVPIYVPTCTCKELWAGCKCGAFKEEMREQGRQERNKKKAMEADLKKGMPYWERVKKHGEG